MAPTPAIPLPAACARIIPVVGDSMAPTLTFNHVAFVVPVASYRGEGIYVLDVLGHPDYVRCDSIGRGRIRLLRDNPRYSGSTMTLADFEAALLGKVVAVCDVIDRALLDGSKPAV